MGRDLILRLCCLAFWVPFCILPVYDLEPFLGFLCLFGFIIYLLFIDQKKKKEFMDFFKDFHQQGRFVKSLTLPF